MNILRCTSISVLEKNGVIEVQTAESPNLCACSISITYRLSTSILIIFMTPNNNFQKETLKSQKTINCNARSKNGDSLFRLIFNKEQFFLKILPSPFPICKVIFTDEIYF